MKRNWKWLIASGAVTGVVAFAFFTSPAPQKGLLEKARRVTSTLQWCKSEDQQYSPSRWLTENQMLALRKDAKGYRCAVVVDIKSGVETPLAAFNVRFSRQKNAPSYWELSPNRKWMLWIDHALPKTWNAATLDGSKSMTWPQPKSQVDWDMPIASWACDSTHWAEMQGAWLNLYSVSQPQIQKSILVAPPPNTTIGFLCGFDLNNQAIIEVNSPSLKLFSIELKPPTAHGHLLNGFSTTGYLDEVALSPQGKKVAWLCGTMKSTPVYMQWLPRLLHPHLWDRPLVEAWVADISGSHSHCLGYVEGYDGDLKDIHWSPDSENLSFRRQNALYVVPAN